MLVIVGRGPSIKGKGKLIDQHTVCRMKMALLNDDTGYRTDFICSTNPKYEQEGIPFWHFAGAVRDRWVKYFHRYCNGYHPKKIYKVKPSTGVSAVFMAVDHGFTDIGLIGFDYVLHPERTIDTWPHDTQAEYHAIMDLGVKITDLEYV